MNVLINMLWIALGGALGALARYGMSLLVYTIWRHHFPLGILCVNILGSFLMGLLASYLVRFMPTAAMLQSFLLIGFLGAFTTFSTFSLDVVTLIREEHFLSMVAYVLASVVLCVLAAFAGVWIMAGE